MKNLFAILLSLINLSQYSNHYIFKTNYGTVFIGSQEGINIYDGRNVKHYFPTTSNMIGQITQSDFFEDSNGNFWFTNYEALHKYNPFIDDFEPIQFRSPYNGELIKKDYRIIRIEDEKLWLVAHTFLFLYNIENRSIERWAEVDFNDFHQFAFQDRENGCKILVAGQYGLKTVELDTQWNNCDYQNKTNDFIYSISKINDDLITLGHYSGSISVYSLSRDLVIQGFNLGNNPIIKVEFLSKNKLLVTQANVGIFKFNLNTEKIEFIITPEEIGIDNPSFTTHHLKSNILWYCIEGSGCAKKDINQTSFSAQIYRLNSKNKFRHITTHSTGLLGALIDESNVLYFDQNGEIEIILEENLSTLFQIDQNRSLGISNQHIYSIKNKIAQKLTPIKEKIPNGISKIVEIKANQFLLNNKSNLYLLSYLNDTYDVKPIRDSSFLNQKAIGIEKISASYLTSVEEIKLSRFKLEGDSAIIIHEYDITGDIKAIFEMQDSFYVATRSGIFICDKTSNNYRKVIDDNKYLSQTIYSILDDSKGNLWLSSNQGIIRYSPITNESFIFTKDHGLPGLEFNTYSYCKAPDGRLYFGGQSGLISFHPDSIELSTKEPIIHISDFQVNGIDYKKQTPFTLEKVELPFDENRLSFGFHAIDYSDGKTKTKYKLSKVDDTWTINNNTSGIVTYPKLNPGDYTFSILGTNSDGVWSKTPKEIHITIHPPWYATWWARSLGTLLIGAFVYYTFRSYYKRQLREKDLQLREANLTIAKQKALSEERTRIAAEMHDDLGGGLTTIRFLSQKALRKIQDTNAKSLISKIANNSETLVNNMSEIIWTMNARFDTLQSLISYCRRYAHEYLDDYEIEVRLSQKGEAQNFSVSGIERRNIFLVFKETLHNIVKHANASSVNIQFEISNVLIITIADNGSGFEMSNEFGNGIVNMNKRINAIEGDISIKSSSSGTTLIIKCPLYNKL